MIVIHERQEHAAGMIWIDDLAVLEPTYLRDGLRLQENGISSERFALALTQCRSSTRAYVLEHIDPELSAAVRCALDSSAPADRDSTFAAELEIVVLHFWPIVYRRFPEEYEKFASCQRYRFDRLFPPALYAGSTLLEVGCGTGKLIDHLTSTAGQIFAIDPVAGMLRVAQAKHHANAKVHFAAGSFRHIAFLDKSMDFVVSNMAFQYHESWGGSVGLRSMKRVLRRGGEIHLTVGDTRTQDFLLASGFQEDFVPLGLRYDPVPDDASPLLRCLFALAEQSPVSTIAGERRPRDYRLAASRWRIGWTISNLLAVARGTPWRSAFHNGRLTAPLGVPVYRLRKP